MPSNKLSEYVHPRIEQLESELYDKQTQLNFLMRITQAINANLSAEPLLKMYSNFLQQELGVKRLAMFFREQSRWICTKAIDYNPKDQSELLLELHKKYDDFARIGELSAAVLKQFELVIPVLHKDDPIAYVLVGKYEQTDDEYDRIKFMITITNIVAVAMENKRLFKQQVQQEAYKHELEVAQRVQEMLIPSVLPSEEEYELSSIYRPHSSIGGDYFDYIKLEDGSFLMCLADVSGKGIPAALLMANFQATLRSAILIHRRLDDLVQYLNRTIVAITQSERIITFFVLRFDPSTRRIEYLNAGHNPPVLVTKNQSINLDKGCTILGALEELEQIEVGFEQLNQDPAMIVLYTDGLTDLLNNEGIYFDEDRITQFTHQHLALNATQFNESLLEELESFKGKQEYPDDIAILTCKIKSPAALPEEVSDV
ncbi:MAG: PP2C family protein-serine/threonine phosphatase [Saprospiraceae bacterium]|nr:PP2C family protein-serine/threonine phosphatase [Saprospiraceae bacterium]